MKDTPEDVRRAADDFLTLGSVRDAAMLTRYADLLERLARPVSDERLSAAIQFFDETMNGDYPRGVSFDEHWRVIRKSLGETE